ncbi:MAG: 50S ribosomal protein L11 methyltransferase [Burkholderiaceae bacterium]
MWIEAVFTIGRDEVEAWADALIEAGAISVQIDDADALTPAEQALFGEPGQTPEAIGWNRSRVAAMLEAGDAANEAPDEPSPEAVAAARGLVERAAAALDTPPPRDMNVCTVAERDWVAETQAQFEPIEIGDRLLIAPSWHASGRAPDKPDSSGRYEIVLDPGLAFGTGSHPTTRMCLHWIESVMPAGRRVIDYGCGSGLLAIAAARLGAAEVVALDIDPQALRACRENARVNAVALDIRSSAEAAPGAADVVIANILASPLIVLAPLLEDLLRPGGSLVLAGLLDRQVDEVAGAYRATELSVYRSEEGWACLSGVKRA